MPGRREITHGFQWVASAPRSIIEEFGITKEEGTENLQAVIDVLNFHMDGPAPIMPSGRKSMDLKIDEVVHIKNGNYKKHYWFEEAWQWSIRRRLCRQRKFRNTWLKDYRDN